MLIYDKSFPEILIKYHHSFKRDFYWRKFNDPYKIMIAEFMLHRTKANQVEPVYINFIKNYTSINILANSSVNEITPFLKSLGLNWRSKHFIESAKFIMKNYNGSFPQTRAKLLEIPGIGDYVAGAILTVCFNLRICCRQYINSIHQ